MKPRVLACVCGVLAAWPLRGGTAQTPILTPRDSALHALNRLAYGPRPGEVDRVAAAGVMQWIDRQLSPDKIDDAALTERERQFKILEYDAGELAGMYVDAQRERRERQQREASRDRDSVGARHAAPLPQRSEEHTSELQSLAYLVCRLLLEKKKKATQCRGTGGRR